MGGQVWGRRRLPGSCAALRKLPRSSANPASSRFQLSTLPPPDAAALTQPAGRPLPRPFSPGAKVCEWGGARGALPRPGTAHRRSWGEGAPSWAGGDGLDRRGRRGAAQLLTTYCPPPTQPALPPLPRPPLLPASQHDLLLGSRVSQGSPVCATFSTPTLLSSHAWGSTTSNFLFFLVTHSLSHYPSPGRPRVRVRVLTGATQPLVSNWSALQSPQRHQGCTCPLNDSSFRRTLRGKARATHFTT